MSALAGLLRERVALLRRDAARDELAAPSMAWTAIDTVWAAVRPGGHGPDLAGVARSGTSLVRVTLRPCAVAVGDRLERVHDVVEVRAVIVDPALPDRIVAIAEVVR